MSPSNAQGEPWLRRYRRQLARLRQRTRVALRRYLPSESQHLFALTLAVGVVCGLVAVAFHLTIQAAEHLLIERALATQGTSRIVWTLLCPTLGGLLAGALLTWLVPGARGSGIPQVKQAFARDNGRVRFRDAFGKFWIASMQIGAGASLGRGMRPSRAARHSAHEARPTDDRGSLRPCAPRAARCSRET
jgi:H+/Cl- antiporter ClcA